MMKLLSKNLLSPILIGLMVWIAGGSFASADEAKTVTTASTAEVTAEQIEQATQATEVKPTDWAYQTLQALGSKYSCSNTPTGDKTLSREEFATSLNSCVQSIEQLVARRRPRRSIKRRRVVPVPSIQTPPPAAPEVVAPPEPAPVAPPEPQIEQEEAISQQDLDRLKGLVQSFSSELQAVDNRLVTVEEKLATVQKQAFSITTKLNGEAIIGFSGYNTGRSAGIGTNGTTANILSNRVRLNFDTSFTGKDRLRTRLQSRNTPSFGSTVTGTNMTRLGYDGDEANNTSVSLLQYTFPLSPETRITAETIGSEFNDNMYTFNPILSSSGSGAISRFGRFNPIYRLSGDGAGLTVNHQFSKDLDLAIGYAVPNVNAAASTAQGSGLFGGSNAIIGQLNIRPAKDLNLVLSGTNNHMIRRELFENKVI
ncbi:iron uptake porin [Chamaesiphon polymorphus]|uniref:Porin n=1 Tax=Chamaesiphon polymorphus CCALA 037 TaxID=2107692 RepID=A0A2T1FWS9_9CYAN|nr:iron uptake porin [Chamaesiphon polymorphus]PSB49453.1 hypothetical protein C7B77_23460 [Chamaesiphon polymorphus CCALA 037]